MQFGPSGSVPSVPGLSRPAGAAPPHPQTMYMQAQPPTHMLHSRATPASLYANPPAAHQQPNVAKPAPQAASQAPHNVPSSAPPSHSLIPAKRRRSPSPPPQFKNAGGPAGAGFSTGHAQVPAVGQQATSQQAAAAVAAAVGGPASQAKVRKVEHRAGSAARRRRSIDSTRTLSLSLSLLCFVFAHYQSCFSLSCLFRRATFLSCLFRTFSWTAL